jgi:hypothetical protein
MSVPLKKSRGVGIDRYNQRDGTRRAVTIKRSMKKPGPSAKMPNASVFPLVIEPS